MTRVLLTAFEPYGQWSANASWLVLVELTKNLPVRPEVTTRLYPVDFAAVREKLAADLAENYDIALHIGQAPGSSCIALEAIGINVGGCAEQLPDTFGALIENGPAAYRSSLPLAAWAQSLRSFGVPARVSYHAGTYLCNAALYYSCHFSQQQRLKTKSAFIHIPLCTSQVLENGQHYASFPKELTAQALGLLLQLNGEDDIGKCEKINRSL